MEKSIKYKENLLELKHNYEIYTGTTIELMKELGWTQSQVNKNSRVIGARHLEIKATNPRTGRHFFGTLTDMERKLKVSLSNITRAVKKEGKTSGHRLELTGKSITEYYTPKKKKTVKPKPSYVNVKPAPKRNTSTMSDYWNDMFRWSVKHLQ